MSIDVAVGILIIKDIITINAGVLLSNATLRFFISAEHYHTHDMNI